VVEKGVGCIGAKKKKRGEGKMFVQGKKGLRRRTHKRGGEKGGVDDRAGTREKHTSLLERV